MTYNVDQEAWYSAETVSISRQQAFHEETTSLLRKGFAASLPSSMLLKQLPYYNLPARKNPAFFGRVDELSRLTSSLQPRSPPKELACSCIYGLSGAGKTQVVLQFAHNHLEDYEAILWVAAETPMKIARAFITFAHELGLSDPSLQHPDQLRDVVVRWLSAKGRNSTIFSLYYLSREPF